MIRDYEVVSPSLDGILRHDSIIYNGIKRPLEIVKILDRPATSRLNNSKIIENNKAIEDYFHDLYGVIVKKISEYVINSDSSPDESVRLLAMLQELIKVKKILTNKNS
jgi:hypothetical protein